MPTRHLRSASKPQGALEGRFVNGTAARPDRRQWNLMRFD